MLIFSSNKGNVDELNSEMPFFLVKLTKIYFLNCLQGCGKKKGIRQTLLVKVNYSSFLL